MRLFFSLNELRAFKKRVSIALKANEFMVLKFAIIACFFVVYFKVLKNIFM